MSRDVPLYPFYGAFNILLERATVSKITKKRRKRKMKIKVVGKAHLEGTSKKTGRPYDFIQIHYLGRARGVIGDAAMTASLDPQMVDFDCLKVPCDAILEFDGRGYPVEFTPVPGK